MLATPSTFSTEPKHDLTLVYYPGNSKPPIKSKPQSVTINDGATIDVKLTLELNQDDQPKEGEQQ